MKHSQIHRRQQYVNISNLVLMEHIVSFQAHTFRTDPLKDKELPFLPPPPPCPRLTSVPTRTNHQSTTQTPQRCHKRHASWFFFFFNTQPHTKYFGEQEDVEETCPKETSKGQWSTTNCISSICCFQQDVAMCIALSIVKG